MDGQCERCRVTIPRRFDFCTKDFFELPRSLRRDLWRESKFDHRGPRHLALVEEALGLLRVPA